MRSNGVPDAHVANPIIDKSGRGAEAVTCEKVSDKRGGRLGRQSLPKVLQRRSVVGVEASFLSANANISPKRGDWCVQSGT